MLCKWEKIRYHTVNFSVFFFDVCIYVCSWIFKCEFVRCEKVCQFTETKHILAKDVSCKWARPCRWWCMRIMRRWWWWWYKVFLFVAMYVFNFRSHISDEMTHITFLVFEFNERKFLIPFDFWYLLWQNEWNSIHKIKTENIERHKHLNVEIATSIVFLVFVWLKSLKMINVHAKHSSAHSFIWSLVCLLAPVRTFWSL